MPIDEMGLTLNKGEFRDALKLRYDWEICVCGDVLNVDHAMVCRRGGFIIQRHNELRNLEGDMLSMVCNDVQIEPVLQKLKGESLSRGANRAPDARLDIHTTVSWIRSKVSFAILRSALLCLRGSRTTKRTIKSNRQEAAFELDDALPKSRSYNFYTYIVI